MVGANYMGGKRNAVKSKQRDATSRAQQGFFGRRRFELLSKGLAPANQSDSNTDVNGSNKCLEISLAHARNKHPQRPTNTHVRTPQPTRDRENPFSNKGFNAGVQGRMTSETLVSLRSLREHALSLPDLAGLKRGDIASCRPYNIRAAKSPQGTNSAKSTHSSYARQPTPSLSFSTSPDTTSAQSQSRWRSPSSRVDQPIFRRLHSDNISLPSFESSLISPLLSHLSSLGRTEKRIRDGESSPFCYVPSNTSRDGTNKAMSSSCSPIAFSEYGEEIPNISTQSGDFDLEDLSEPFGQFEPNTKVNVGEESPLAYSDLGSPFRFTSPSDHQVSEASSPDSELRGGNHRSLLLETDAICSRSPIANTSSFTWLQTSRNSATPSPQYDCQQSPRLSNGSPAWFRACIFSYEDPWDAIGIIMGLSPNNPNKLTLEEELATFGADEFGCETAVSDDAGSNNALEDYSDERTSCTMFSPTRSWVDTMQRLSGLSCISHCNNAKTAHPMDACRSSEPTDLADVSTGCLVDGDFMAPDCFDEDSALTCYGTRSQSCTKNPAIALSLHWPLSPAHTISINDSHFPLLSYDRQSERFPNKDLVTEEKPETDSATMIVPFPERPSLVEITSFLPLAGDDGGQVESHFDNHVGTEPSLALAYPSSSTQPAEDLNSHTIKGNFRGLHLFRDDSDADST